MCFTFVSQYFSPLCCCCSSQTPPTPHTSNLPPPSPPPQRLLLWVCVQSCQSLAEPAKLHSPVRGEAGGKRPGLAVGPAGLPPPSSEAPQQIEPPAGRHGPLHGSMLRAHMPPSTNSPRAHKHAHGHWSACLRHMLGWAQTTMLSPNNYISIHFKHSRGNNGQCCLYHRLTSNFIRTYYTYKYRFIIFT